MTDETAPDEPPAQMDPLARGVGIGCLGLVVLVLVLVAVGSLSSNHDQGGQVKIACRDWVKDRLKSPGSAHFSGETVERDGNSYVVSGSVDSDNSFGARVRNEYRCEATNGGGSSRLVSLTGIDN